MPGAGLTISGLIPWVNHSQPPNKKEALVPLFSLLESIEKYTKLCVEQYRFWRPYEHHPKLT